MSIKNIVLTNNSGDFILPVTSAANIRDIPCKDVLEKAYADNEIFSKLLDLYNSNIDRDDFTDYEKQACTSSYVYFKIKNNSSDSTFDKLFNAFNALNHTGTDYAVYEFNFYSEDSGYLATVYVRVERSIDPDSGDVTITVLDPTITQGWTILEASSFVLPANEQLFSSTTFNDKQDTLESGTNIKTINSQSILGSGDIQIASGTEVVANPTLAGTEGNLDSIQINGVKYKLVTRAEFDWLVNSVQALAAQSGHSLAMASYQDGTNTTLTGEDQSGNGVPIVYENNE